MKLLFVGPWPPPFGGIASNLYELLPGLALRGCESVTLSYTEDSAETRTIDPRASLGRIENVRFSPRAHLKRYLPSILRRAWRERKKRYGLSPLRYLRAVTIADRIDREIARQGTQVVFTYDNEQLHAVPFVSRDHLRRPHILSTIYAGFFLAPDLYQNEAEFLRFAVKSADRVMSCSAYCANSGKSFLGIDYETRVLYNNVDEVLYSPDNSGEQIRSRFGIPSDAIVLMTMARMSRDMGYDFLLDNLQDILALDPRLYVFLVGASGDYSGQVADASARHDRVRHAFDISFEDKPFFFAACDIFTAPSREQYACLGIANIEAMMSGKAVISSTSGGHVETIEEGVTGVLVPFKDGVLDRGTYMTQLKQLIESKDLRERFGQAGRVRALAMFTNDKIVQDHLDVIGEFVVTPR